MESTSISQVDKQPFPAQLAVMSRLLTALINKENAILESSTGSGKTLAVLCSSLSWQKQEMDRLKHEEIEKLKTERERTQYSEDYPKHHPRLLHQHHHSIHWYFHPVADCRLHFDG